MHFIIVFRTAVSKRLSKVWLCSLACFLCFGFSFNATTCAIGETLSQPSNTTTPQRIVVFPLYAEEMLFEMISPDRIVYVGHEYWENAETFSPTMELTKNIPGSAWADSDSQEILDLKPDLIILWEGEPGTEYSDVPLLVLKFPTSIEDIKNTMVILGEAVGAPEKAAQMLQGMEDSLTQITKIVSKIPEEKRVHALHYEAWQSKFRIVARAAGVIDEIGGDENYSEISLEQIAECNPDLITINPFMLDNDDSPWAFGTDYVEESLAYILDDPKLSYVKAVKNHNVHTISLHASQFIVQSVKELAQLAYPDLFPEN